MEFVDYTVDGTVAIITLDRPPMNALNAAVIAELAESFDRAKDESVRAVVLTGATHFAAGADITGFQASFEAGDQDRQASGLTETVAALEALEKPTIAAITGYALGGGLELSMGADFRYLGEGEPPSEAVADLVVYFDDRHPTVDRHDLSIEDLFAAEGVVLAVEGQLMHDITLLQTILFVITLSLLLAL